MEEDLQEKLKKLQFPFNWCLTKTHTDKVTWDLNKSDLFIPQITFTKLLTSSYIKILNMKYEESNKDLCVVEHIIDELNSPIKKEVARHIFDATKSYLLLKEGNLDEANEILKNIKNIDGKIYLSALNEFKAYVWTHCLHRNDEIMQNITIEFAELAIEYDPDAAIAHYLISKTLRRFRRLISVFTYPGDKEMQHILKAYKLDKNPQICILAAVILKEKERFKESTEIFKKIYDMELKDTKIQLRLALAFTQRYCFGHAKKCLDYVETESPDKSGFLHYKGLYFMKKKQYKEASNCLLKAVDAAPNYAADMSYIQCIRQLNEPFDYTSHFLKLREKYFDYFDNQNVNLHARRKAILLHIAFCYFDFENDLEQSTKYFLLAFEIVEDNFSLKTFRYRLTQRNINVYDFMQKELLPKVQGYINNKKGCFSEEFILASQKLKVICEQQLQNQQKSWRKDIQPNFSKKNLRPDLLPRFCKR